MGSEGTRDANRGAWQTASSLTGAARAKSSQAIFDARRLEKQMSGHPGLEQARGLPKKFCRDRHREGRRKSEA